MRKSERYGLSVPFGADGQMQNRISQCLAKAPVWRSGQNRHPKHGFQHLLKRAKMQLKRHSFLESIINVAVGYGVALLSQILVFPIFGIHVSLKQNVYIGLIFTVISIVRSYFLRRIFNHLTDTVL
jgi:hypothetical protein